MASPFFPPPPAPVTPKKSPARRRQATVSPYFSSKREPSFAESSKDAPGNNQESLNPEIFAPDLYRRIGELKPCLIQEQVAHDPWKLLVAVTLLNKTSNKLALPMFWKLMELWPTPLKMSLASEEDLTELLTPLGTQRIRSRRLIKLSQQYLLDPPSIHDPRVSRSSSYKGILTPISHLPGAGPYALDSYRIFCTASRDPSSQDWKEVEPTDKELRRYLKWKWAYVEGKEWSPEIGVVGHTTEAYLKSLEMELGLKT